ncbi:type II toxin-antitoxin system HipA family toxin [Photobacterium aphoticum]|uniref:Serine/threonine protein kinase n=1 Tax=Photobacterium aphoticum TaxID=754436 RepID=A0A0J1GLV7_9GAMM|nr:type II toxin-antitoxin system HipA family toxin [Photobacterium aphoticum]KLV00705.1 serine/threonine protein kinase [Photobacterium aphoticum]PSU58307.1 type II toxin-antitoxin system HipA family toxin [Photobacterium aphoticum]GHA50587.1 serine/threonine protein kinase [Photobacterium aphoticum]
MDALNAYMNGERVGEFIKLTNGAHEFQYDTHWIESPKGRPLSLSLPLQYQKHTSSHVINYFDNLLPDLTEIRDRIVARYQADSRQTFDLLKQVGKDSVGAIALYSTNEKPNIKQLNYEVLSADRLVKVLSAYQTKIPLGMLNDEDDFRISIAGAQEKTALLKMGDKWCIPKGSTPTTHIIKLPIGEIKQPNATLDMTDSVENEYLCLLLAKALGFNVPHAEIIKCDHIKALAVERFDRRWSTDGSWLLRLPQEDMCQAFGKPSAIKYETDGGVGIKDIMKLLLGSSNALADREMFMRFQVFQWIIGATDGHAKNFSIFLGVGGSYQLTPFYDILSAYPLLGGKGLHLRSLKLAMGLKASKGKKYPLDGIFARHFIATAKDVGFSIHQMNTIIDEFVAQLPGAIERVNRILPEDFPEHISQSIFENSLKMAHRLTLGR